MNKSLVKWLLNVSIVKKFIPLLFISIFGIIFMCSVSVFALYNLVQSSNNINSTNIHNKDTLNSIARSMYICRVVGRDILLEENEFVRNDLYSQYIQAFEVLDTQMEIYNATLSSERRARFQNIIISKDIYKQSMLASADTIMSGGDYSLALQYQTRVNYLATNFFSQIETFLYEEQTITDSALAENENLVRNIFITIVLSSLIALIMIYSWLFFAASVFAGNLNGFKDTISGMIESENLRATIPEKYFTNDEVGFLVKVINRLKNQLIDYSMKDVLTGGLNVTAYYADLSEYFDKKYIDTEKKFWLALFDMNNLKQINDKYGHIEGDRAIRLAYRILSDSFSLCGKLYRVGGDEFVALFDDCTEEMILDAKAKMEQELSELTNDTNLNFSIASGYGEFNGKTRDEFDMFFVTIDEKMYKNKDLIKQERAKARVLYRDNSDCV